MSIFFNKRSYISELEIGFVDRLVAFMNAATDLWLWVWRLRRQILQCWWPCKSTTPRPWQRPAWLPDYALYRPSPSTLGRTAPTWRLPWTCQVRTIFFNRQFNFKVIKKCTCEPSLNKRFQRYPPRTDNLRQISVKKQLNEITMDNLVSK